MLQSKLKPTSILSGIIIVLTLITASVGLLFSGAYQENIISNGNAFSKTYWYGNDLVTLLVAVPLLTIALILARRGSLRAQLVWLGVIHYTLYNYAFYLFGAAINWFFPLYLALFVLPIFVLVFTLANMDISDLGQRVRPATPSRWISGFMFFFVALLAATWTSQWVSFLSLGLSVVEQGNFIRTVAGIDISLLGSGLVLGAVWLWKRQPWGYVIAAILNISFAIYALVLTVVSLMQAMAGVEGAAAEAPFWIFLGMACLASSVILLMNLQPSKQNANNF
jgi:hypothetical protein